MEHVHSVLVQGDMQHFEAAWRRFWTHATEDARRLPEVIGHIPPKERVGGLWLGSGGVILQSETTFPSDPPAYERAYRVWDLDCGGEQCGVVRAYAETQGSRVDFWAIGNAGPTIRAFGDAVIAFLDGSAESDVVAQADTPRKAGRPPLTSLDKHQEECARAYQGAVRKGGKKAYAAQLQGHDVDTLDRWVTLLPG
jgi:hypothetical protein